MHRFYPAPCDRYVRWIVRGYWLLSLSVVAGLFAATLRFGAPGGIAIPLWTAALFAGIGLVCWAQQPRLYLLQDGELRVERRAFFPPARLDLATVRRVAPLASLPMTLRLWGNGGLYSWVGWFWSRGIGTYWMCATNLGELVLLDGERRWVVSPENRAEFVAVVYDHLGLEPPPAAPIG